MALTSLEAIAQKLQEKKQTDLESILKISGSAAISKNEYGVNVVNDNNAASSLIFKPLVKSKLDDVELLKAIDTEVKELKPNIPEINRNLVPKPLYDDKVVENDDLRKKVKELTTEVEDLSSQVSDLKNQVQSETNKRLSIEQTNDVLANQMDALSKVIDQFSGQIQSAVQKSVDESILRASLQSQNSGFKAQIEALIKQIDSLNSIIEGLQAQLGAVQQQQAIQQSTANSALASGGDIINKVVILSIGGPKNTPNFKLHGKVNPKNGQTKFESGGELKFVNNDKQPVTIEIEAPKPQQLRNQWLQIPKTNFQLAPGGEETIKLSINPNGGDGVESEYHGWFSGWGHSGDYDSTIVISVTRYDSSKDSKTYPTKFTKNYPGSF